MSHPLEVVAQCLRAAGLDRIWYDSAYTNIRAGLAWNEGFVTKIMNPRCRKSKRGYVSSFTAQVEVFYPGEFVNRVGRGSLRYSFRGKTHRCEVVEQT